MKVSWQWLSQLIDLNNIEFYELTEKLTLAGFEIEEIYELPEIKDKIIDIKLTANRQDASFLIGLAREISTLFNKPLKNHDTNINNNYINQISNNTDILYQSLDDLKIQPITNIENRLSPKWLQNYLRCYNIQATDILNNIIEYIKIKWGQDIEIFDAKKIDKTPISNNNLTINNIGSINQIIQNKNLSTNKELLKYKNTILSIIGIQSNPSIRCDLNTSSIIVCGTICKPTYIKRTTKELNIKTEKSTKHLKQILRCDFLDAYKETIKLISTFAKGTIGKSYEYHNLKYTQPNILINKSTIYNILGPIDKYSNRCLSVEEILKILHQLKFKSTYNNIKQTFNITIPMYRTNDMKRPIDVIEEIGRIYGFERFNNTLPETITKGHISNQAKTIKKIRKTLRDMGIHEVIHYSLKKQNQNQEQNKISLFNPLTEDQAILQDNLFTNLVEIQKYNIKQKNFNIEAFEIGKIFTRDNISLHSLKKNNNQEEIYIAGIIGKSNFLRHSWTDKPKELSWFQAKGTLEELFEKLQATIGWEKSNGLDALIIDKKLANLLDQKRTCIIYNPITQEKIGFFGQLKNNYSSYTNCTSYIFEIHLSYLMKAINNIKHLHYRIQPYSSYPSVTRDISIKLSNNENIDKVCQNILNQNNSLLESVEIFNEYQNDSKENRNIGLRITYRAKNRTLNDTDIIKIDKEIKHLLSTNMK